jgi:hypothetical protein
VYQKRPQLQVLSNENMLFIVSKFMFMLHRKLKNEKSIKSRVDQALLLFIEVCAVVVIWLTFWSLIPRDEWWFRGADFPDCKF